MKSREPVLVHGRDEWDQVNLPESTFRKRLDAIREAMSREDVDALLVYGRGDDDGHLCYVSNLVNKVPNWGLLVSVTQDGVLVRNERSSRTRPVIERGTYIEDIQFVDNVVEDVADIVGGPDSTVATAGFDRLPYQQRRRFARGVGDRDVVSFDDVLMAMRSDKSRRERDQVARAARMLTDVHDALPSSEGQVGETDLAGEADRRARLRGAQDFRFLVANPSTTEPHLRPAEDRTVAADDPLVVYTAGRFEGYWAECARTLRLDGDQPYGAAYDDAVAAYTDFLDALRAGRDTDDAVAAARDAVDDAELALAPDYDFGHGIGLAVDEAPVLDEGTTELRAGMTVSARLAVEPDADSLIVLNDTLEVRDGEPVVLTGDW